MFFATDAFTVQDKVLQKWLQLIWVKVFKNGPSKICGRQPLKNLKGYGLLLQFFEMLSSTSFTFFFFFFLIGIHSMQG